MYFVKNNSMSVLSFTHLAVQLVFTGDYQAVKGQELYFEVYLYNLFYKESRKVILDKFTFSEGSVIAKFQVSGQAQDVENELNLMKSQITNLKLNFFGAQLISTNQMWVDDVMYDITKKPKTDYDPPGMSTGQVVAAVVVPMAVCALIISAVVVYKFVKGSKVFPNGSKESGIDEKVGKRERMSSPPRETYKKLDERPRQAHSQTSTKKQPIVVVEDETASPVPNEEGVAEEVKEEQKVADDNTEWLGEEKRSSQVVHLPPIQRSGSNVSGASSLSARVDQNSATSFTVKEQPTDKNATSATSFAVKAQPSDAADNKSTGSSVTVTSATVEKVESSATNMYVQTHID